MKYRSIAFTLRYIVDSSFGRAQPALMSRSNRTYDTRLSSIADHLTLLSADCDHGVRVSTPNVVPSVATVAVLIVTTE